MSEVANRWRTIADTPWAALRGPLSEARVAIVTSAALYRPGLDRDFGGGGDITMRLLPSETPLGSLVVGQSSDAFDRTDVERDMNLALPLDRLRELQAAGEVGSVAPRAVSFNGSMLAPGKFLRDTAPKVVHALRADLVHAALFVPV